VSVFLLSLVFSLNVLAADGMDLSAAAIVTVDSGAPHAATVLSEEVASRTGLTWPVTPAWPDAGAAIVVVTAPGETFAGKPVPAALRNLPAEGYGVATDASAPGRPVVWISGADARGTLYGVGYLLRHLDWADKRAGLSAALNATSAPAYRIRGHQLGYRPTANSWDAWDVRQFEQYIRELALFGANCIENIPFQDFVRSEVMKIDRREMNRALSELCAKYDLDYWVWTPATFDLNDADKRAAQLRDYETLCQISPRLDHIFFPGGDPGDNPPELVMPYLEEIYGVVSKHHPNVRMWISLQGFEPPQVDVFYQWLEAHNPAWLAGVASGPGSPPIAETRARLPRKYAMRHYPDITHTVRCQYPVPWLDPAFAFTLGREPVNPRPVFYKNVHNTFAPSTDGFLTYSDGVHDDVNKAMWSMAGWDPNIDVRQAMEEYCRVFFNGEHAGEIADALLAFETNWKGSLTANGGVDAVYERWKQLEPLAPADNWRWQMCLLRANYDYYVRHRLLYERQLESDALAALMDVNVPAGAAIDTALATLAKADTRPLPEVRAKIESLCAALYESIGLQTSVDKYHASGLERGAVLDYVDYPLNNRRWLEDELAKVRAMGSEDAQRARMAELAAWEDPGPGGFYDNVSDPGKCLHVVLGEDVNTDPAGERHPLPDFMWLEEGRTRVRQSWIGFMNWPIAMRYEGLDPACAYVIRAAGYGECLLKAAGRRLEPSVYGKGLGDIKEFPVPAELYADGQLMLTFDTPDEEHLNWRQQSRLCELWVMRKK